MKQTTLEPLTPECDLPSFDVRATSLSTLDYLRQKKKNKSSLPNVPHQEPPRTPSKYQSPPSQPCGSFLSVGSLFANGP